MGLVAPTEFAAYRQCGGEDLVGCYLDDRGHYARPPRGSVTAWSTGGVNGLGAVIVVGGHGVGVVGHRSSGVWGKPPARNDGGVRYEGVASPSGNCSQKLN